MPQQPQLHTPPSEGKEGWREKPFALATLGVFFVLGLTGPFTALAAGPAPVDLMTAGNFAILSKSGISTTGPTSITGNIGTSPIAASGLTGFGLIMDVSNTFSTSARVTGKVYAADYTAPTPSTMSTAINDMQTAYTNAAGRTLPTATELGAGNIGGMTLAPGLYKWSTSVTIPTDITLSGGPNDVWIFQIAQTLTMSSATKILLSSGAQPSNIFWVVGGQTTIGTTAVFNGNILDQTAIVFNTGAQLNGRALAQTAVTLDSNSVTAPAAAMIAPPAPVSTSTPTSSPIVTSTPTTTTVSLVTSTPVSPTPTSGGGGSYGSSILLAPTPVPTTATAPASALAPATIPTPISATVPSPATSPILTATNPTTIMPTVSAPYQQQIGLISGNLVRGRKNSDVRTLQQFLIIQNKGSAARALGKVGTTSYFGSLTRRALAEFQLNVGIKPAWGNFGPITRAYVSAHYN